MSSWNALVSATSFHWWLAKASVPPPTSRLVTSEVTRATRTVRLRDCSIPRVQQTSGLDEVGDAPHPSGFSQSGRVLAHDDVGAQDLGRDQGLGGQQVEPERRGEPAHRGDQRTQVQDLDVLAEP